MKKIILTVGISGSGKSTWASKMVQENPSKYIRVNRDTVRNLLYGYTDKTINEYYKREDVRVLEKEVSRYCDTLIYDSLELDKIVICDNTNLDKRYINDFKKWNVPIEFKVFNTPLDVCIGRDLSRERSVGEEVIKKQYSKLKNIIDFIDSFSNDFVFYLNNDSEKPWCYVYDIDGTLAHKGDRNAFDWKSVGKDSLDEEIATVAHYTYLNEINVIATGRDSVCFTETKAWLADNDIMYSRMYMREERDMRPDWKVKQEMAEKICEDYYIAGWFDDRLQVTRHLRMLGIKVLNVSHGNF